MVNKPEDLLIKNIEKNKHGFDHARFLDEVNNIFQFSHLNNRNTFLFKDSKPYKYEVQKSFDVNFIPNPLNTENVKNKYIQEGYTVQIRGIQAVNNFFNALCVSEFKKTFCLNNYNLYLSHKSTNAFKKHKDPHNAIIYFLKGG